MSPVLQRRYRPVGKKSLTNDFDHKIFNKISDILTRQSPVLDAGRVAPEKNKRYRPVLIIKRYRPLEPSLP